MLTMNLYLEILFCLLSTDVTRMFFFSPTEELRHPQFCEQTQRVKVKKVASVGHDSRLLLAVRWSRSAVCRVYRSLSSPDSALVQNSFKRKYSNHLECHWLHILSKLAGIFPFFFFEYFLTFEGVFFSFFLS